MKRWVKIGAAGGLVVWALLITALLAQSARATGSLAIPNTIAAQAGPNVQASLLDTNWTTIANYVNAREVLSGTLGARPAAGTAGRWYFASDDNGGTLYFDTGSAWTQASPTLYSGQTAYASRNLAWATSSATNTTFNGTADYVTLRNPTTGTTVTRFATTTVSNDILTSGPAAGGRDQSGTFSVSSWVHFYYVWNGSTLSSVSSTCAPNSVTGVCPTVGGPTLPSGYTHWAYIGPVRMATAGTLNATWIRGARAAIEPYVVRTTAAGTGAEQSYDDSDRIPPNHLGAYLHLYTNRCDLQNDVRVTTSGRIALQSPGAGANIQCSLSSLVPLVSQTVYFLGNVGATSGLTLTGYKIPNGGD